LALLFSQLKIKTLQTAKGTSEISGQTEFNFVLQTARVFLRMGMPLVCPVDHSLTVHSQGCHALALDLVRSWSFERPAAAPSDKLSVLNGPPSPQSNRRSLFAPAMRRQASVAIDMDVPSAGPTRPTSPDVPNGVNGHAAAQPEPTADASARKAGLGNLMKSAKQTVQVAEFDMDSFGF
jgi:hypothetical protein